MIPYELAQVFAQLQQPATRAEGTRALAALASVREVLLFGIDQELDLFLPAPGLPQTLRDGSLWQGFLRECAREGASSAVMPDPGQGSETQAYGMIDGGGLAALVFLTARPAPALERPLHALLPLLGSALALERRVLAADGRAEAARDGLRQARELAAALEEGRRQLQAAHDAAQVALAALRGVEGHRK